MERQSHLIVHSFALPLHLGGPPVSASSLCNCLCRLKIRVEILTTHFPACEEVHIEPVIKVNRVSPCRFYGWELARPYQKALEAIHLSHRISLVHNHSIWLPRNRVCSSFCSQRKIPLVISPRGMLTEWALKRSAIRKKIAWIACEHRNLSSAAGFHATCPAEAQDIRRVGLQQPIAIIPNGVHELPPAIPTVPTAQGFYTALFLSRIHPKKGLPMLLEAWRQVATDGWKLHLAGGGEAIHVEELKNTIQRLGLDGQITLLGPVHSAQKEAAYSAADLFILPSYSENFGNVVVEALQHGVPVITTTGTPWKELVDNACGWWVAPTVPELAATLRSAMALPGSVLAEMGARGKMLVQQKYLWPRKAEQMKEFYIWLIEGGTKPDFVV